MNRERFGQFLAENRKAQGKTQREIADRLHVTDQAVSKWERGLSYPDVTLLEPLAETLEIGVEELVACQRKRQETEREVVKNMVAISGESISRARKIGWQRLLAVVLLMLAAGAVILYGATFHTQQLEAVIQFQETIGAESYLYVERQGHLLALQCGKEVDTAALQVDGETEYLLECRWNQWTSRGTVKTCTPSGRIFLGSLMDTEFEVETAPLFGYPAVHYTSEKYYPNPYGEGFLCDYRFWVGEEPHNPTILLIDDCLSATVADLDGDQENEVIARTRWAEKPCVRYDWDGTKIVKTLLDKVPEKLTKELRCVWEA